jgi:hypothetical protein
MTSITIGFIQQAELQNCKITGVYINNSQKNSSNGGASTQSIMVKLECSHGHEWEDTPQKISKKWCIPCKLINMIGKKYNTSIVLLNNKWSYNETDYIMVCEKGHKFTIGTNALSTSYGCTICNTISFTDSYFKYRNHSHTKQISYNNNDIICGHRKMHLEWSCNKCNNVFYASPEILTKYDSIKRCPHSIKVGSIHNNGIICKNIIENMFMLPFTDVDFACFGRRAPTAYNAKLNLAIHYVDPKEFAWYNSVMYACEERDIVLIKIKHTKWTQKDLLGVVLKKLSKYIHISNTQHMIDKIMPVMYFTPPSQILTGCNDYPAIPVKRIPRDPLVENTLSSPVAVDNSKLETDLLWKDPESTITYNIPFPMVNNVADGFIPTGTFSPPRSVGFTNRSDDGGYDDNCDSSDGGHYDDCGNSDMYRDSPLINDRPQSVADLMTQYLFDSN